MTKGVLCYKLTLLKVIGCDKAKGNFVSVKRGRNLVGCVCEMVAKPAFEPLPERAA